MTALEITTKIMTLGFNRTDAGILSKYCYQVLKWNDFKFVQLGLRMFKDKRTNLWGDDPKSNLEMELRDLLNIDC